MLALGTTAGAVGPRATHSLELHSTMCQTSFLCVICWAGFPSLSYELLCVLHGCYRNASGGDIIFCSHPVYAQSSTTMCGESKPPWSKHRGDSPRSYDTSPHLKATDSFRNSKYGGSTNSNQSSNYCEREYYFKSPRVNPWLLMKEVTELPSWSVVLRSGG